MSDPKEKGKGTEELKRKIIITLTSKNLKNVESVTKELASNARALDGVTTYGPKRMPVKKLKITCRKTPCGEGSKTWDKFEMKIYKRVIELICSPSLIKEITSIRIDPGVLVELSVLDD